MYYRLQTQMKFKQTFIFNKIMPRKSLYLRCRSKLYSFLFLQTSTLIQLLRQSYKK